MNEEANFCDQCGVKISSDTKFCPNCGHDLKNSSTKITSDKTIKVEVTNVTVEKGFKAVKNLFKTKEKTSKPDLETPSPKHREFVFFILIPLGVILGIFAFGRLSSIW